MHAVQSACCGLGEPFCPLFLLAWAAQLPLFFLVVRGERSASSGTIQWKRKTFQFDNLLILAHVGSYDLTRCWVVEFELATAYFFCQRPHEREACCESTKTAGNYMDARSNGTRSLHQRPEISSVVYLSGGWWWTMETNRNPPSQRAGFLAHRSPKIFCRAECSVVVLAFLRAPVWIRGNKVGSTETI